MNRTDQVCRVIAVGAALACCWLLMQAVHELGHALHAWATGGRVERIVLRPLEISRTDVAPNPRPLVVAWGGAIWGTLLPLGAMLLLAGPLPRYAHALLFFAGFCATANGLYLAAGLPQSIGDAGDLLRHGAPPWQLVTFGVLATALGLWLWHTLGPRGGLPTQASRADRTAAATWGVLLMVVLALEWLASG